MIIVIARSNALIFYQVRVPKVRKMLVAGAAVRATTGAVRRARPIVLEPGAPCRRLGTHLPRRGGRLLLHRVPREPRVCSVVQLIILFEFSCVSRAYFFRIRLADE